MESSPAPTPGSPRKNKPPFLLLYLLLGCIITATIAIAAILWLDDMKSFADRTALLVEISPQGIVTLSHGDQTITGKLADVNWINTPEFHAKATSVIRQAQSDKVEWQETDQGIFIWYLNQNSQKILLNGQIRNALK